ncbi:MAG: lysophospholipase [Clostridiales bacterium]|nr:lysophospholipase [Clostridiales bacterium]
MSFQKNTYTGSDGKTAISYFIWTPSVPARGVVQIVHGMCEYVGRYTVLALYLAEKGYVVCGEDHLGHGQSVGEKDTFGFFAKRGGADLLIEDVEKLHQIMVESYPGKPYIMLGHSMGSFIARNWYAKYGESCDALILSGTGTAPALLKPLRVLARIQRFCLIRDRKPAKLIAGMINKTYLKKVKNPATPCDWISYDAEVCKRYMGDPFCTFTFTHAGYIDLFNLLERCSTDEWYRKIPKDKPILILSGDEDPVGDYGAGPRKIYNKMIATGQEKVTLDIRHGMRHEPHNEVGREAIYQRYAAYLFDNFARKNNPEA